MEIAQVLIDAARGKPCIQKLPFIQCFEKTANTVDTIPVQR